MTDLKTLITELQKPVTYKWKIQAVPKNGKKGNCVAYIDSRDCMNALDHNCLEGWQNEFYEVKGKVFCRVGIKINGEWQWRSDSGALESSEHIEEETTSKGETSDAFKRACVQWGIGRFLYEKDIIWISEEEYTANKFKINEFCMGREKGTTPKTPTTTTPAPKQYTGGTQTAWFNKKELKMCIAEDNAFSKQAIEQWAIDEGYKLSGPSRVMIDQYLSSGEL